MAANAVARVVSIVTYGDPIRAAVPVAAFRGTESCTCYNFSRLAQFLGQSLGDFGSQQSLTRDTS